MPMPNFSTRYAVSDCYALRISDLRRAGAVIPGSIRNGTLQFEARPGAGPLTVGFTADLTGSRGGWLELRHLSPEAPAEPLEVAQEDPPAAYRIALVSRGLRHGATVWSMICPARGVRSRVLFLPPGGDRFASSKSHNLLVESDRLATPQDRAAYRVRLCRARLEAAQPKKGAYQGGRGATGTTLARLRAAVADAELRAHRATAARAKAKNE